MLCSANGLSNSGYSQDVTKNSDTYCFEMLSMVLALSGSSVGRAYLSHQGGLLGDLLSLLHTGSARVQRQVRLFIYENRKLLFRNIFFYIFSTSFVFLVCFFVTLSGQQLEPERKTKEPQHKTAKQIFFLIFFLQFFSKILNLFFFFDIIFFNDFFFISNVTFNFILMLSWLHQSHTKILGSGVSFSYGTSTSYFTKLFP